MNFRTRTNGNKENRKMKKEDEALRKKAIKNIVDIVKNMSLTELTTVLEVANNVAEARKRGEAFQRGYSANSVTSSIRTTKKGYPVRKSLRIKQQKAESRSNAIRNSKLPKQSQEVEPPLPPINLEYTAKTPTGPLFRSEKKEAAPLVIALPSQKSPEELAQYYEGKFRVNTKINGMLTIDNGENERQLAECNQRAKESEIVKKKAIQMRNQKMLEDRRIAENEWKMARDAQIKEQEEQLNRVRRIREDYENDVLRIHRYSLVAWQTVYGACQQAKELCNKFQNPFLRIMLDNLVTVSDNLFYMLMEIDNFLKEKSTIFYNLQKFETIKQSDNLATWELRELEASGHGHFGGIRDPLVYSNSIVKIEEVANISNSTRV
uniref:BZIP domain-containing protein n=1 Tax=Caenorhabditis tropicalis TaxID=1561998 RepID=A0A1I7UGG5_9PELO